MGKYDDSSSHAMSRTKRNSDIYSSIELGDLSRIKTNNNVSVISEAPKQIDIEKIKKYIYMKNNEETETKRRATLDLPEKEEIRIEREEPKEYDINTVLEKAKESQESNYESIRYKKINNTEYDILNKIKIEDKNDYSDVTEPIDELNTEEKTIVNLINDISKTQSIKKDELFSDLMSDNENTVVMAPITDEVNTLNMENELESITRKLNELQKPLDDMTQDLLLEKERLKKAMGTNSEPPVIEKIESKEEDKKMSNIDKSFFTNSLSFNKGDFESISDDKNDDDESDSGFYSKFAIIMIIIVLLITGVIIANYIFDLNWF